MRINLFALVMLLTTAAVFAQPALKTDSVDNIPAFEKLLIPGLDVCIQSALTNSPLLKANDEQTEKLLEEIKIKKKSWLDYVQIDANSRYGLFNMLTLSQTTGGADIDVQQAK